MGGDLDGREHNSEVVVVNVNWNAGNSKWNVNTDDLGNEWNAGNQFVSRNSNISPSALSRGSFRK